MAARLGRALYYLSVFWVISYALICMAFPTPDPLALKLMVLLAPFAVTIPLCYVLGGFAGSPK